MQLTSITEKPSIKAIQERIGKLRKTSRDKLAELGIFPLDKSKHPASVVEYIKNTGGKTPDIDNDGVDEDDDDEEEDDSVIDDPPPPPAKKPKPTKKPGKAAGSTGLDSTGSKKRKRASGSEAEYDKSNDHLPSSFSKQPPSKKVRLELVDAPVDELIANEDWIPADAMQGIQTMMAELTEQEAKKAAAKAAEQLNEAVAGAESGQDGPDGQEKAGLVAGAGGMGAGTEEAAGPAAAAALPANGEGGAGTGGGIAGAEEEGSAEKRPENLEAAEALLDLHRRDSGR